MSAKKHGIFIQTGDEHESKSLYTILSTYAKSTWEYFSTQYYIVVKGNQ